MVESYDSLFVSFTACGCEMEVGKIGVKALCFTFLHPSAPFDPQTPKKLGKCASFLISPFEFTPGVLFKT